MKIKQAENKLKSPSQKEKKSVDSRIHVCLITEEFVGLGRSGGIGAAFYELAYLLPSKNIMVDILYCPIADELSYQDNKKEILDYALDGIRIHIIDYTKYVNKPITHEKKSYAVAHWLVDSVIQYSHLHFHDYKGLGFFSSLLKKQGLGLCKSKIIVQTHGPTRWTIEANNTFFTHEDQLTIDYMERLSIANADCVVSPSQYLLNWFKSNDYHLPADVRVIKNLYSKLQKKIIFDKNKRRLKQNKISDIILFARHEDRKGFSVFCEALDSIKDIIYESDITVSFLGAFGSIDNQHSGLIFLDYARRWRFPVNLRTGWSRDEVAKFIVTRPSPIIVVPSKIENSPYAVLESLMLNCPIISSSEGGGIELFKDKDYSGLIEINKVNLAATIHNAIENGLPTPQLSEDAPSIEKQWHTFHLDSTECKSVVFNLNGKTPKVTFAITHFDRPEKLLDAIFSIVKQTYPNIELIVIDDGSASSQALEALEHIEAMLVRLGGRLVRTQNRYLGAARNEAISLATGEYICFLDDDDIAVPTAIEKLVIAALNTNADLVSGASAYMNVAARGEVLMSNGFGNYIRADYVPVGGPFSLAPIKNCFGTATALFKIDAVRAVGGYSEITGVGHEDYELYIRLIQSGRRLTVIPFPLIHYEIGRPSMLSKTNLIYNFRRSFDSINIQEFGSDLKDFINLKTGQDVEVNSHNRAYWLNSLQDNGELRNQILNGKYNRDQTLEYLIELSLRERLPSVRSIFLADLSSCKVVEQDLVEIDRNEDDSSAVLDILGSQLNLQLFDVRLDFILDRHENGINRLITYFKKTSTLSQSDLDLLLFIISSVSASSVSTSLWRQLTKQLFLLKCPRKLADVFVVRLAAICILSNDVVNAVKALCVNLREEERSYLLNNNDVSISIKNGQLLSGLQHYLDYGIVEGRVGFASLSAVRDLVKDLSCFLLLTEALKNSKLIRAAND